MERMELIKVRGKKTQAEMGVMFGVAQQTWSSWEKGRTTPVAFILKQMELSFGIPMETLFPDVFDKRKS